MVLVFCTLDSLQIARICPKCLQLLENKDPCCWQICFLSWACLQFLRSAHLVTEKSAHAEYDHCHRHHYNHHHHHHHHHHHYHYHRYDFNHGLVHTWDLAQKTPSFRLVCLLLQFWSTMGEHEIHEQISVPSHWKSMQSTLNCSQRFKICSFNFRLWDNYFLHAVALAQLLLGLLSAYIWILYTLGNYQLYAALLWSFSELILNTFLGGRVHQSPVETLSDDVLVVQMALQTKKNYLWINYVFRSRYRQNSFGINFSLQMQIQLFFAV